MELNITEFFNNGDHWHNSNSVANLGQNAGQITWDHAKQESQEFMFVTDLNRSTIQDYIKGFGAWEWDEITSWTDIELNALVIQFISADINELDMCQDDDGSIDWDQVEELQSEGTIAGNLFKTEDNEFYYYIGY